MRTSQFSVAFDAIVQSKKGDDGKWHLASQVKGLVFAPTPQTTAGIEVVAPPPPLPLRPEPVIDPIDNADLAGDAAGNGAVVIQLTPADIFPDPGSSLACPECGEHVTHAVKTCPGCGFPLDRPVETARHTIQPAQASPRQIDPPVEAAPHPVRPVPASPRHTPTETSRSPSPFDAVTKQACAIVNELRQMDFRNEIVPINASNLPALLDDGIFWFATLLGIVPLVIVTLPGNIQLVAFSIFFAAVWGVIFRSAIVKYDTSWKFLWPAMFFTGIVGVPVAFVAERLLLPREFVTFNDEDQAFLMREGYSASLLKFIFVIGLCEELCKLVPPIAYLLWKRTAAQPMTVLLLGVFSGLGFAASENWAYAQMAVEQTSDSAGVNDAMIQAMLRSLSCVFCHAVWAGILAYFLASASISRRRWGALFLVGLALAIVLHGSYDWFLRVQPSFAGLTACVSFILFYGYIAKLRWAIASPDKPEVADEAVVPIAQTA